MDPEPPESERFEEIYIPAHQPDPPHLEPAIGYMKLGLWEDALEELDKLTPEQQDEESVFDMRIEIFMLLPKYEEGLKLASDLSIRFPEQYNWPMSTADFLRYLGRISEAVDLARATAAHHPDVYLTHYHLAALACVVGDLTTARSAIQRAIEIWPEIKKEIKDDPDLEPIWDVGAQD